MNTTVGLIWCPICKGSGRVPVSPPDCYTGETKQCPHCEGKLTYADIPLHEQTDYTLCEDITIITQKGDTFTLPAGLNLKLSRRIR